MYSFIQNSFYMHIIIIICIIVIFKYKYVNI